MELGHFPRMKILFALHLFSHGRHFTSVLTELAARGHDVTVLGVNQRAPKKPMVPEVLASIPGIKFAGHIPYRNDFWGPYVGPLRVARNLLLYQNSDLAGPSKFHARAEAEADPWLTNFVSQMASEGVWKADRTFETIENSIPIDGNVLSFLEKFKPDILLVSPLIFNACTFMNEYVRAANLLGIRVVFPVFSWDNLSTKGSFHAPVDRVLVWNETQKDELIRYHKISENMISVLGAWRFDEFMSLECSTSYMEFCEKYGLSATEKLITYLGSSPIIAPQEGAFVEKWLRAIRAADDPLVRNANIFVRAHPRNKGAWDNAIKLVGEAGLFVQTPDEASLYDQQLLFDCIGYASAVVGINTSAMLEAAILGRPVHTVNIPDIATGQAETVHYRYLSKVGGGLLYEAADFDVHVNLLAKHLRNTTGACDPKTNSFRTNFLDSPLPSRSASSLFVDEIERVFESEKMIVTSKVSRAEISALSLRLKLETREWPVQPEDIRQKKEIQMLWDGEGPTAMPGARMFDRMKAWGQFQFRRILRRMRFGIGASQMVSHKVRSEKPTDERVDANLRSIKWDMRANLKRVEDTQDVLVHKMQELLQKTYEASSSMLTRKDVEKSVAAALDPIFSRLQKLEKISETAEDVTSGSEKYEEELRVVANELSKSNARISKVSRYIRNYQRYSIEGAMLETLYVGFINKIARVNINAEQRHQVEPGPSEERISIGGLNFFLPCTENSESDYILTKLRRAESVPLELSYLVSLLGASRPGSVMIDVGANLGTTALIAALSGGYEKVVAIEAVQTNADCLAKTIKSNGADGIVDVVHAAVGDKIGNIQMALVGAVAEHHVLAKDRSDTLEVETVALTTIDDLIAQYSIDPQKVSFLKSDVQGYDYRVMLGAEKLLALKDTVMFVEYWPWGMQNLGDQTQDFLDLIEKNFDFFINTKSATPHIAPIELLRDSVSSLGARGHTNLVLLPSGFVGT